MNNLLRGIIAGIGAKKLGGGCFGTVIVFIIIWTVLGQCSNTFRSNKPQKPKIEKEIKIDSRSYYTEDALPWITWNKEYVG